MVTPSQIIASYRTAADRRRRTVNAYLFKKLVSRLDAENLTGAARSLRLAAAAHEDPAADPTAMRLYKAFQTRLARSGHRHLPIPIATSEEVRRRQLWAIYRKVAAKIAETATRHRLVFVTLTVRPNMPWRRRLDLLNERSQAVTKALAHCRVWYAHAYDVQGELTGRSPHLHSLYVVDEADCDEVARALRALPFRRTVAWPDNEHGKRNKALLVDRKRREGWLQVLAYIVKVSADCGERHFLPPPWDDAFQHVRIRIARMTDPGTHALHVQAMYAHYKPEMRRIVTYGLKVRASALNRSKKLVKLKTSKMPKGRPPATDPGKIVIANLCVAVPTMKGRAAALGVSEKTLRKWMARHGLRTPRGP